MQVNELIGGPVVDCGAETTVAQAARTMIDNETGSLAVLDHGDLVGIFTERDLIRFIADGGDPATGRVGDVMTPDPDSLEPDVELVAAADWMLAAGYRHLPIVADEKLVGMMSIKDVLWGITEGSRRS